MAIAALLAAPATRAAAQAVGPPLTLSEARAAARHASPEVRAAREAVAAARGRERQAGAAQNPTLSYGREQTSGAGQSNAQDILSIEQAIEGGGLRSARVDAARHRREAAEARLEWAEMEADFAVTRAYAVAIAADRRAQLADQAARAFTQAATVSEQRLAAGDVSGYATRRVRLEAARYAALRAEALLESREARLALGALVAADVSAVRSLDAALVAPGGAETQRLDAAPGDPLPPTPEPPAVDSLRAAAFRSRAELRVAELEARAADADARVAARERNPAPVLRAGFKTETSAGVDERLTGFVAGVALPIPLFDRRQGAVEAARAEARRREAEVESVRRRVAREVTEAREGLVSAHEQLALLAPQLGAEAERALRAAQVAYAEGEITLVEWLDAVRAYQEVEASHATLRAEALIRRAALERAVGAPLPALPPPLTFERGTGR
jgi:outer membrane protein, heavy metal efflux system